MCSTQIQAQDETQRFIRNHFTKIRLNSVIGENKGLYVDEASFCAEPEARKEEMEEGEKKRQSTGGENTRTAALDWSARGD